MHEKIIYLVDISISNYNNVQQFEYRGKKNHNHVTGTGNSKDVETANVKVV